MLIFGAGLITGGIVGVVLMCLCFISGAEERCSDGDMKEKKSEESDPPQPGDGIRHKE